MGPVGIDSQQAR